ncbi:MAG: 3'-5' exonuclease [Planctomycetes bacterium]|nr:3'-5' exonuclease [Planctomycetota bacterium]
MEIGAATFVVLDVETTGLDPASDRICEVGAIKVHSGRELGRFQTLVNPERPMPVEATRKNGITDDMLKGAPMFAAVAPDLRRFLAGTVLVAQNAEFDLGFLNAEFRRGGGSKLPLNAVDTIALARAARPGLSSYRLDNLAAAFGARFSTRHRSIGDCEVTAIVFRECLRLLRPRTLEDLMSRSR